MRVLLSSESTLPSEMEAVSKGSHRRDRGCLCHQAPTTAGLTFLISLRSSASELTEFSRGIGRNVPWALFVTPRLGEACDGESRSGDVADGRHDGREERIGGRPEASGAGLTEAACTIVLRVPAKRKIDEIALPRRPLGAAGTATPGNSSPGCELRRNAAYEVRFAAEAGAPRGVLVARGRTGSSLEKPTILHADRYTIFDSSGSTGALAFAAITESMTPRSAQLPRSTEASKSTCELRPC